MRWTPLLAVFLALPVQGADSDILLPSEVTAGDRGICVTEVDGGERVELPLTVLGHLDGATPEGELVLVRLEDPRFDEVGIARGMSGSPVYVGGRLLGAVAYGWSFATEPIAGVTPFVAMKRLAPEPRLGGVPAAEAVGSGGLPGRPPLLDLVNAWASPDSDPQDILGWWLPRRGEGLVALELPVGGTGMSGGSTGGWLGEMWRRMGWVGVPGGRHDDAVDGGPARPRPGSMVAGVLVDGDATLSVGGTVTEVQGENLWAFGHPFLGGGSIRLPMAAARVVAVLPSAMNSFKMFSVGSTVGSFRQDRAAGVWGQLDEAAPTLDVQLQVDDREYAFTVVRDELLMPFMVAYLTNSSYASRGRTFGGSTVTCRLAADYGDAGTVDVRETFAALDAPAQAAAFVSGVLAFLEGSAFGGPEPRSLRVELEATEDLQTADILAVDPGRRRVRPGQELSVAVRLRPRRGPEALRMLRLKVPRYLAPGKLDLIVSDGSAWTRYDLKMRPLRAAGFGDELRSVARLVPSTTLVAALERPSPGAALPGGSLEAPPSVLLGLAGGLADGIQEVAHHVVASTRQETEWSMTGAFRISLEVVRDESLAPTEEDG